jgi:hypothetical protein
MAIAGSPAAGGLRRRAGYFVPCGACRHSSANPQRSSFRVDDGSFITAYVPFSLLQASRSTDASRFCALEYEGRYLEGN